VGNVLVLLRIGLSSAVPAHDIHKLINPEDMIARMTDINLSSRRRNGALRSTSESMLIHASFRILLK
jgi:hypothetical protein